ncbi:MAG: uncharacterized protein A8A55_2839 [Amphiamblys sp. WSBS2006]|nr:MAG: uncharacterized protein A8A55_2839 [Amphiamblys sp. WSBS2006]
MRTYLLEDIVGDTPRFREHLSNMEKEMSALEKQIDEVQCQLKKKEETKQMESPVLRDSSSMELLSETGNLLRCVFDVFWREEMKRRETEKRLGRWLREKGMVATTHSFFVSRSGKKGEVGLGA